MKQEYNFHQMEGCSSLEEAVQRLMDELMENKDVYRQIHRLAPHQGFPVHRHFTTNEWVVVYDAEFDFVTGKGSVDIQSFNKATVIYVPMGTCHTVRSTASALTYVVAKDGPDDFNLC